MSHTFGHQSCTRYSPAHINVHIRAAGAHAQPQNFVNYECRSERYTHETRTHTNGHAAASIRRILSNLNCSSDYYFYRCYYLYMQTESHTHINTRTQTRYSYSWKCSHAVTNGPKSSTSVVRQKKHARESDASELLAAINVTIKAIKRCTSNREQIKIQTRSHIVVYIYICTERWSYARRNERTLRECRCR